MNWYRIFGRYCLLYRYLPISVRCGAANDDVSVIILEAGFRIRSVPGLPDPYPDPDPTGTLAM